MAEQQFRFDIGSILTRLLMSLVMWGLIAGLPLVVVWAVSVRRPVWLYPAAAAILVVWLVYTRRHWARIFDRSPQLVLDSSGVRARQLGNAAIPWANIIAIQAQEAHGVGIMLDSAERALLILTLANGNRHELDVRWLGHSPGQILKLADELRSGSLYGTANDLTAQDSMPAAPVALGEELRRYGPYSIPRGFSVAALIIGLAIAAGIVVGAAAVALATSDVVIVAVFGGIGLVAAVAWTLFWRWDRAQTKGSGTALLVLHRDGLSWDIGAGPPATVPYASIRGVTLATTGGWQRVVLACRNGTRLEIGPFTNVTMLAPRIGQELANLAKV